MQNNSEEKPLKIGKLAKLCGLSERTIRYYERLGIIKPMRTEGGTRLYRDSEVEVARIAQRMRDLDIPVEEIRKIATKRREFPTGDQSSTAMIEILENLVDELGERISKTLSLQEELIRTVRLVQRCRGCENKPTPETCPDCPMGNAKERTSLAQMIWQQD